jgi:hypothetical protein
MTDTLAVIQPAVFETYGDGGKARVLAESIALGVDTNRWRAQEDGREDGIRILCWSFFAGGSTAAIAARRIETALRKAGL